MRKRGRALLAGAAVAALASSQAFAATVIVNPGDSIQSAIDGATAGDTIKILNGRYNQNFTVTKQLKIQGESKTGVILDGAGLGEHVIQIDSGVNSVVVKNLTIAFSDDNTNAVRAHNTDLSSLESTVVKGIRGNAFEVYGTAATVKSNLFRGNRGKGSYVSNSALTYQSNKHYRGGGGLESYAETFSKSNQVEDCGTGLYIDSWSGPVYSESNSTRRMRDAGMQIWGTAVTLLKGSHKSVSFDAVNAYAYGGDTSVTSLTFKKVRGRALSAGSGGGEGGSTSVTLTKVDNCYAGISVEGSNASVTASSVKNGGYGIDADESSSVEITGNILKNLLYGGIDVDDCGDCFIDANTLTEIGANEGGAIEVTGTWAVLISNNIVGDVDGGDGIYAEELDFLQVGGVVSGYAAGNIVSNCQFSGIRVTEGYEYYYDIGEYSYYSLVSQNTIVNCGDLDNGGVHLNDNIDGMSVYQNNVSLAGGTGIHIGVYCDYNYIWGNLVVTSETNGILVDGGWGGGYANMLVSNVITGSGSEGIDNGGYNTTIAYNNVSGSGIFDFANGGSVYISASTGNTPQPADWNAVPAPRQLDY